jgi:hypothetical protein
LAAVSQTTQEISAAGGALLTAAPFTGPAAPFVAIAGAITEMLASFGIGTGCGQTCVLSSDFANQAEALLQENISTYFGIAPPRPQIAQTAAEANFNQVWNWLVQQCSNPQLGQAGQNCISERQQGACFWHQTGQPQFPGQPAYGQCWNWYASYYAPIATDPAVPDAQASTAPISASSSASAGTTSGAGTDWAGLVPVAIGAVAVILLLWSL